MTTIPGRPYIPSGYVLESWRQRLDLIPLPALVAAGLLLGVGLATPVIALGRCHRGEPLRRVLVSTGLLAFFALQLAAGLMLLDATWPLTGYPMYAVHIPRGAVVEVLLLEGTTRGGATIDIPGGSLFADPLDLQARVLPALRDPASQGLVAERLLRDFNRAQAQPDTELIVLRGTVERRGLDSAGTVTRTQEPLFVHSAGDR